MQDTLVPLRSRSSGVRVGVARPPETKPPRTRTAEATCSVRVIRPFARYLARLGCDCDAWLGGYGLTVAALKERDLRVPHGQAMALLREAAVLSGDPAIGIR